MPTIYKFGYRHLANMPEVDVWGWLAAPHVGALDHVAEEAEEAAVRRCLPLELARPAARRHRHRDLVLRSFKGFELHIT